MVITYNCCLFTNVDMIRKKMINVTIHLYQHTTPPFCLQTAGVQPVTSQRFGDIVREKSDMFYNGQLLLYDKKLYNLQCHTSDKNRTILSCTTISYDFYRLSDISFTIMTMREHFSWYAFTINPQRTAYHCCIRRIIIFFIISLRNNKIG